MTSTTRQTQTKTPLFVAISDIHFNLTTLPLASRALLEAIETSNWLGVPLIVCGDLNDTKAVIRSEVAKTLIDLFQLAQEEVFLIVGNHDLNNEKGSPFEHSLHFLAPYTYIVDFPRELFSGVWGIPYQTNKDAFKTILKDIPEGSILAMHQGVLGAHMGEYVTDKTSIDVAELAKFTCISGHYHRHQTIKNFTYIGSPFTMSFAEAGDPAKGFLTVNTDGTFDRKLLEFRKHQKIKLSAKMEDLYCVSFHSEDILWVTLEGTLEELRGVKRADVAKVLKTENFKFDKIILDESKVLTPKVNENQGETLDRIIEQKKVSETFKSTLKQAWRSQHAED